MEALVITGLLVYFLPTAIALLARKRNSGAIFTLNLLLGWTLIGWAVAMIWAALRDELDVTLASPPRPPALPQTKYGRFLQRISR